MYQASQEFVTELNKTPRMFKARLTAGTDVLSEEIKTMVFAMGSCGADAFTIGSVFASYVDITLAATDVLLAGREFFIEIGLLLPNETVEYVPMGYYTISPADVAKDRDAITLKAMDRISSRCGGVYVPTVTFPCSIQAVLDDVETQAGITIETSLPTSGIIETAMTGLLYRDVMGYIAGLLGGFCYADRNGTIRIAAYPSLPSLKVDAERFWEIQTGEDAYSVDAITVAVSEGGVDADGNEVEGLSYTSGSGIGITVSNPYMTEELFAAMKTRVLDYSFYPGAVNFLGDPQLGPEDAITAVNYAGKEFLFPCMSLIHDYDGGLTTTISTPGLASSDSSTQGPLSKQVERLVTEMVLAKEVIAKKITADEANLKYAQIDLANIKAGCITTAMLGTGVVGTAQIADGSITDAKIVELTANKITAGTLSVERLEIRGSTNSIVYGLNNITGALQAQNVDTLNGEILTPRTITADRIVANSITGNEIAARTIIANNIVSGSITGNEIAAGTIKAVNIDVANLFAQDITATGTIRGVNLVGATGSFSGSVTIGASGGQMTLKTNDNYPIFTIEPTSGYSGYVQFSRGYFHFTDEENYEIYGGSGGLTLSAMGVSPMKINASSGINVDVNDTIWLTSTNSAANVVLDGFNYLTVNGKVAVSGSLTANTVTSTALNITQYGRGMTCVTDFGNAAIVTLSDGSGLYLATNKTGVSGWASNILLADTNGVNLIPKTGGTFTGSVRCSAGLTVNGDLVETSNMILYHGKGLYGQADGGSNNWIAGIEKRSSGTSSAAVNCVRIGQNTLRTYVYTASSVYSNGAWNNFSDRRLKEEFTKLDKRYLDMFDNLNPTLFLWKDKRDTRKQAGYVAQEVLAAMNAAGISESENTIVNKTWEYYDIDNKEAGGMEIYSLEYEGIDTIAVYALQDTRITVKQHGEDIEDLKQKYLELANENILLKAQIEFLQQQIAA